MKHIKIFEDFVNEAKAEKHYHVIKAETPTKWWTGSDFSTNPADAMVYDMKTADMVAKRERATVYTMTNAEMKKAIKSFKANESTELEEALNEISLSSAGVKSFLTAMYTNADVIKKLGFKSFKDLVGYIKSNDLHDWDDLRAEVKELGIVITESEDFKVTKNSFQDFDTLNITQFDKIQFKQEGNKWIVRAVTCHDSVDTDTIKKLGFGNSSADRYAGISTYTKNANWHPLELTKKQFDQLVKTVDKGWKSHAKSFADFYSDREAD